jgi:hypothetical protein
VDILYFRGIYGVNSGLLFFLGVHPSHKEHTCLADMVADKLGTSPCCVPRKKLVSSSTAHTHTHTKVLFSIARWLVDVYPHGCSYRETLLAHVFPGSMQPSRSQQRHTGHLARSRHDMLSRPDKVESQSVTGCDFFRVAGTARRNT